MSINSKFFNALLFNLAWFLCVSFGNAVAVLTCVVVLFLHFRYISKDIKELLMLVQVVMIGVLVDGLLITSGVLINADDSLLSELIAQIWMIALWLLFATTLNHCFVWLQSRLLTAALLGAIAGPFSYWVGTNLSSLSFALPLMNSLLIVGLVWALVFPLCLLLAKRYNHPSLV